VRALLTNFLITKNLIKKSLAQLAMGVDVQPGTQVQIPANANLGSYCLFKKLAVGVSPTAFLSKKTKKKFGR
jgi:hypothetical protein